MAHQKIIADEKERSIMITPERIDALKQVVEENKGRYEHADAYLEVLNRWGNGDFSMVDYDHNLVMYSTLKTFGWYRKRDCIQGARNPLHIPCLSKEVDDVVGSKKANQ